MAKDAMIRARVESNLKETAEGILKKLGLSPTDAITLFYKQIELRRGLPFAVALPNEKTIKTFHDTDEEKGLVCCRDTDDIFTRLGI